MEKEKAKWWLDLLLGVMLFTMFFVALIISAKFFLVTFVDDSCPSCEDCVPVVYLVSEAQLKEGFWYTDVQNARIVQIAPDGTRYIDTGSRSVVVGHPSVFLKAVGVQ